jgi:hypothetical protein
VSIETAVGETVSQARGERHDRERRVGRAHEKAHSFSPQYEFAKHRNAILAGMAPAAVGAGSSLVTRNNR